MVVGLVVMVETLPAGLFAAGRQRMKLFMIEGKIIIFNGGPAYCIQ